MTVVYCDWPPIRVFKLIFNGKLIFRRKGERLDDGYSGLNMRRESIRRSRHPHLNTFM